MVAVGMRDDDLTIIGRAKRGGIISGQEFGVSRRDRRQHLDVQGQTGTGKSTLLKRMLLRKRRVKVTLRGGRRRRG